MAVNYGAGVYGQDGLTSSTAAPSAMFLKAKYNYGTVGLYWINLPTVG